MGTNYYVRPQQCDNPCSHCGQGKEIHLGKSSAGWKFLHRAYRGEYDRPDEVTWPVVDRPSWLGLLNLGPIVDEYGREQDREELLAVIEAKQDGIALGSRRARELSGPFCNAQSRHDFTVDGYDFSNAAFS